MVRKPCVYKNLAMEMFVRNMTIMDMASRTHTNYKALCRKLNGDTVMTLDDAIRIHEVLEKVMPIEKLFSRE